MMEQQTRIKQYQFANIFDNHRQSKMTFLIKKNLNNMICT